MPEQKEAHEMIPAEEAKADQLRGRRLRKLIDFCVEKPSVPLFLVASLLFGRHQAMQLVGLEADPGRVTQPASSQQLEAIRADLRQVTASQLALSNDVHDVKLQVRALQQDVLDVALKRTTMLHQEDGPRVAGLQQ